MTQGSSCVKAAQCPGRQKFNVYQRLCTLKCLGELFVVRCFKYFFDIDKHSKQLSTNLNLETISTKGDKMKLRR